MKLELVIRAYVDADPSGLAPVVAEDVRRALENVPELDVWSVLVRVKRDGE